MHFPTIDYSQTTLRFLLIFIFFSGLKAARSSGEGAAGVCNYISNKAWIWSTCLKVNALSHAAPLTTKETEADYGCDDATRRMCFTAIYSRSGIIYQNQSIVREQWRALSMYDHTRRSYVIYCCAMMKYRHRITTLCVLFVLHLRWWQTLRPHPVTAVPRWSAKKSFYPAFLLTLTWRMNAIMNPSIHCCYCSYAASIWMQPARILH